MFMGGYYGYASMIFLIPAMVLVFWAQYRVKKTFEQWSKVPTRSGITAAQVARDILNKHRLEEVGVEYVQGHLSDHYDPRAKVVRLSSATHNSTSIAAIGVAAHEVGHAIQHDTGYFPLQMRNMVFPVARIGDMAGPFLVMIGLIFGGSGNTWLMDFGIAIFSVAVLFYVVTLPVEFNASSRAVEILESGGYMTREEVAGSRKVLNAAALTYVAAAAASLSQLIRLIFLRNARR